MKEIMVLYKDHTFVNKDESKIDKYDIRNSELFLIKSYSGDEAPRNYIPIRPNKLLLFDKAVFTYQILIEGMDDDVFTEENYYYETMPPVTTETTSITNLINLFNCVVKCYMLNLFTANNQVSWKVAIRIAQFGVSVYRDGKEIYNKGYANSMKSFRRYLDSSGTIKIDNFEIEALIFTVLRDFTDIYDINAISRLIEWKSGYHNYLHLLVNNTWEIIRDDKQAMKEIGLIGVPLRLSSTITFCTKHELKSYWKYNEWETNYSVHDNSIYNEMHEVMTNMLMKADYKSLQELYDDVEFMIITDTRHTYVNHYERYRVLDILSHLDFIINMSNLVLSSLYNGDFTKNDIETIISVYFGENYEKEIQFNNETIIPLRDLLEII